MTRIITIALVLVSLAFFALYWLAQQAMENAEPVERELASTQRLTIPSATWRLIQSPGYDLNLFNKGYEEGQQDIAAGSGVDLFFDGRAGGYPIGSIISEVMKQKFNVTPRHIRVPLNEAAREQRAGYNQAVLDAYAEGGRNLWQRILEETADEAEILPFFGSGMAKARMDNRLGKLTYFLDEEPSPDQRFAALQLLQLRLEVRGNDALGRWKFADGYNFMAGILLEEKHGSQKVIDMLRQIEEGTWVPPEQPEGSGENPPDAPSAQELPGN